MADHHSPDNIDRELEELLAAHRDRIAYPEMAESASKARERIENAVRPTLASDTLQPAPLDGWDEDGPEPVNTPHLIPHIDQHAPGKLRQIFTLAAAALAIFIVGGLLIAVLPDIIDGDGQPGTAVLGPDTTGYEFAGTIGGSMIPNEPVDVAVDSQGNIYAADVATGSVHKFDSSGTHLASWTADDAEVGPFVRPWSLAIEDDTLYVLDQRQAAVYRLDTEGNVLSSWRVGDPEDPSSLFSGIDVNQHGHVYIANSNAGTIVVYDGDGAHITDLQVADDPQSGGERPLDVAISDDGRIFYTSYAGNEIRVLDTSGTQIHRILAADLGIPESFYGVTLGNDGFLYANSSRTVAKFTASDYQSVDGVAGWEFDEPIIGGLGYPAQGVGVDSDGVIYIADTMHHRIIGHAVGEAGMVLEIKDTRPDRFSTPGGVEVDGEGSIYTVDSNMQQVTKFAPDGTLLDTWEWEAEAAMRLDGYPGDVALTEEYLYVLDGHESSIVKLTWSGEKIHEWTGSLPGDDTWGRAKGLYADVHGDLYLLDQFGPILKYDGDGQFSGRWDNSATGTGEEKHGSIAMAIRDEIVYVVYTEGSMPGIWTLGLAGNTIERVVEFSRAGDGSLDTFASSLAIAPSGDLFTIDPFTRTTRWYSPEGELKSEWALDTGETDAITFVNIAISNTGTVYVSDGNTRQILIYKPVSE
ncbi:hypothetical protein BH23CHL1_BH23CHL1_17090 [soil metagenome]